jgi:hypothetical protein
MSNINKGGLLVELVEVFSIVLNFLFWLTFQQWKKKKKTWVNETILDSGYYDFAM